MSSPFAEPLSDDDFGRVNAMAAALPTDVDLRDEAAMLYALHAARFEAGAIGRLAPFVAERARELRALFGPWDTGDILGGIRLLIAILSFSFLGCIADAETARAAVQTIGPCAERAPETISAVWMAFTCLAAFLLASAYTFVAIVEPGLSEAEYVATSREADEMVARCGAPIALDAAQFDAARWRAAEDMRRRSRSGAVRSSKIGAR